ncbi:hypothetical protein [Gelidibacter pelagius]|uniref:Lipoprotein n=1 Tax=Gelidibacter pelagius TaxID=2819985 RepID=A0ABS3SYX5_9FLAO|nr:hypothetical protein [Gelidibacter pelagius]MBO3099952.1 hypothetical protein [Gelidibacter pelagius]
MKFNTISRVLLMLILFLGAISCKETTDNKIKTIVKETNFTVFNFDNKQELAAYNKLNLDHTHPNLLNPKISTTDYEIVIKSWTDLHQRIGNHLSKNAFHWEVKDSSIVIVHKIYFKPNGNIESYFFNILNDDITKEKKEQFALLISDFAKHNRIEFKSEESFAQCGKTKYVNN